LPYYDDWLNEGHHGSMEYLKRHRDLKADVQKILGGAKSFISLLLYYDNPEPLSIDIQEELEASQKGWISRYVRGGDYHDVITTRHKELISKFQSIWPEAKFVSCVDSKPVLERDLAYRAGLGWIGKNTCLINQGLG